MSELRVLREERDAARREAEELRERVEALEGGLRYTVKACEHSALVPPRNPAIHDLVASLGRQHGFGAVMSAASRAWRDYLLESPHHPDSGGEFVAGPCRATMEKMLLHTRALLAPPPERAGEEQ